MVAAAVEVDPTEPVHEPRVLLHDVPWATYVVLRDTVPSAAVRMTYLEGCLEIMSPSRRHEVNKTQLARLLELFCLEREIPLYGYGSTTFRKEEKERGLEPDECYARGADKETPDVAVEVVVTRDAIDKLEVYRGLGIGEVWRFAEDAFTVYSLRQDGYEPIPKSVVFPEIDLDVVARFAIEPDQHEALQAFRTWLRASPRQT